MEETGAPWDEGVTVGGFPALEEEVVAEVVIIGGGITGLTAAYLLSREGRDVVVLEKDRLGWGATGATTAFLTQYLDTPITELIEMFGVARTRKVLASHAQAIEEIETIVAAEKIECEFIRCPAFVYAVDAAQQPELKQEQGAAERVGVTLSWHQPEDPQWDHRGFLRLEQQGKFHPLQYLSALVQRITERGGRIYEHTEAREIGGDEEMAAVKTKDGQARAPKVIVATHAPFDRALFLRKASYTSCAIEAKGPMGKVPEGIYQDTLNPYHYFRVDRKGREDRIIIGGEDHRSDIPVNPAKHFQALEDYLRERLPGPLEIKRRWSGPIVEPVDGLAYIGPLERPNVFYATGFSGNGMTYGTLAAKILTDRIQGRRSRWRSLYGLRRKLPLRRLARKGADYTKELWGGAVKNALRYRGKRPSKLFACVLVVSIAYWGT